MSATDPAVVALEALALCPVADAAHDRNAAIVRDALADRITPAEARALLDWSAGEYAAHVVARTKLDRIANKEDHA